MAYALLLVVGGALQCCGLWAATRRSARLVRLMFCAGVFLVCFLAALDRDLVLVCAQLFLLALCWRSVTRNST